MRKSILIPIIILSSLLILVVSIKATYLLQNYIFMEEERQSLKTKGGAEITIQFDMRDVPANEREQVFKESQEVMLLRLKLFGFHPFAKALPDYKMSVELAHVGHLDR